MSKSTPAWLAETKQYCESAGIPIVAWGPNLITVEARGSVRAKEVATQMGALGFQEIPCAGNVRAGLLDLSKDPIALREEAHARIHGRNAFDLTHPCWQDTIQPAVWLLLSMLLIPGLMTGDDPREPYWLIAPLGFATLAMFLHEGARIWGWRMEITDAGVRVRRNFFWKEIPWEAIERVSPCVSRGHERSVTLTLADTHRESLGTFFSPFAQQLRTKLESELAVHHAH
jgi:hypothetical protein